jgi:hypothetical protein
MTSVGDKARVALAGIRIFNGALGLFGARTMARRVGSSLEVDQTFVYPARMFGVRTLVLGVDLLVAKEDVRRRALREAVVIHATDTLAACYAGRKGELDRRAALLTTSISAINTTLAVTALVASSD